MGALVLPAPLRIALAINKGKISAAGSIVICRYSRPRRATRGSTCRREKREPATEKLTRKMAAPARKPRAIAWAAIRFAPAKSLAPTDLATRAAAPVPMAAKTKTTEKRIRLPRPVAANSWGPRRPTMAVSTIPTIICRTISRIAGQASLRIPLRKSAWAPSRTTMGVSPVIFPFIIP